MSGPFTFTLVEVVGTMIDMETQRPLTLREQVLVDKLPEHNWSVTKAALAAGYTRGYAETNLHYRCRHDLSLSQAIAAKRREIGERTWTVEQWREMVAKALAECIARGGRTTEKEILRMIGQHIGAFEADNRQRQTNLGMVIM